MAVNAAISGITYLADKLIVTRAEIEQNAMLSQDSIEQTMASFETMSSTLTDTEDRYAELAQGVETIGSTIKNANLSPEEFDEFLSLSNLMAEVAPELVKNYDLQGNAILDLKGNVDDITDSLDAFIEKQKQASNASIGAQTGALYANAMLESDEFKASINSLESQKNALQKQQDILNSEDFSSSLNKGLKNKSIQIDTPDYTMLKTYEAALSKLGIQYTTAYQFGFEGAVEGYSLKILSDQSEIDSAMTTTKDKLHILAEEYGIQIEQFNEQILTKNQELDQTWNSLKPNMFASISSNASYLILSDEVQNMFDTIFSNIDFNALSELEGNTSWEDMYEWLTKTLIEPLQSSDSSTFTEAFAKLFDLRSALEEGDIDIQDYMLQFADMTSDSSVFASLDENIRNAITQAFTGSSLNEAMDEYIRDAIDPIEAPFDIKAKPDINKDSINDAVNDTKAGIEETSAQIPVTPEFVNDPELINVPELALEAVVNWSHQLLPLTENDTTAIGEINWLNKVTSLATSILYKTGTIVYNTITKGGSSGSGGGIPQKMAAKADGTVTGALWNSFLRDGQVSDTWRLPYDETALVGEVKPELLVRNGVAQLIGAHGSQFMNLKKGDIIFNHKQTEMLLRDGAISGRGRLIGNAAFAAGTVHGYASGSKSAEKLRKKFDKLHDWLEAYIDAFDWQYDQQKRMAKDLQDKHYQQNAVLNQMISSATSFQGQYGKMYDTYMKQAYASGLSKSYQKKVMNGTINIASISNEKLKAQIEEFSKWYEKARDVQDKVQELKVTLKDLYTQKLTNIEDDFDRMADYYGAMTDRLESLIDMRKTIGQDKNGNIMEPFEKSAKTGNFEAYYKDMLSNTLTSIDLMNRKYSELSTELERLVTNGQLKRYSDDWYDWQIKLQDVYESIDDAKVQYKKILEDLRDYRWEAFNSNIDTLEYGLKELDDVMDTLNDKNFVDSLGNITGEGAAQIALLGTAITKQKQILADYTEGLKKLDAEFNNGIINQEEYTEYMRDYLDEIRDASKAVDSYKDSLLDLYKEQMEAENKALKENISLRQEAFNKKQDYYEYDKKLRDKNKDINALKAQIAAMEGVSNAAGKAELIRLKAELANSQSDLEDTKRDHAIDLINDGYDAMSDKAEEAYDKVMDTLTRSVDAQEKAINSMLERIKTSYADAFAEITAAIERTGMALSTDTKKTVEQTGNASGAASLSDSAQTPASDVKASDSVRNIKTGIDKVTNKNAVTSVTLNKTAATVNVGSTVKLTASVRPAGTSSNVSWKSSNTSVASVSGGTVTGRKAGTAKITASCGSKSAACTVTVKAAPKQTAKANDSGNSGSNLKKAVNTTGGHRLRKKPGYGGEILTSMPKGSKVTLLGPRKKADGLTWAQVKYGKRTGWTSTYYLRELAGGTKRVTEDMLAITQEQGPEIIVSPSSGRILYPASDGMLTALQSGDGVIRNDFTENLMEMGRLGAKGLIRRSLAEFGMLHMQPSGHQEQNIEYHYGDYNVQIYPSQKLDRSEIENISEYCYDDWFKRMKKDQRAGGIKRK